MKVLLKISEPSCALSQQKGEKSCPNTKSIYKYISQTDENSVERAPLKLGGSRFGSCCKLIFKHYLYKSQPADVSYEVQFHQKSISSTPFVELRQLA